jgi:6-phosphogluconolactonase
VNRRLTFFASLSVSYCLLSLAPVMLAQTPATTSALPATQPVARYAYALAGGQALEAYSINPATGYLRPLAPFSSSNNFGIAIDPSNRFVYVPIGGNIWGYKIAANGWLQNLTGSPFTLLGGSTMVFTHSGKFAYSNLEGELSLNSTTGVLTQIGSVNGAGEHVYVAINPAGSFVYVLNIQPGGGSSISAFSVDQTSGDLTEIAGSPFAGGGNSAVVSPDGKFLFVATAPFSGSTTAVYSINSTSGVLTPVAGSPFSTPGGANGMVVNSAGQFLYLAGDTLSAYSINPTTGALTAITGSPYTLPANANSVTLDPSGKFLYVSINSASKSIPGIISFSVNSTTGTLKQVGAAGAFLIPVEAIAISTGSKAVVYTPKFAYVTNQGSKTISEWTISDTTGALTGIAGSPIADKNGPQLIATTPSGAFVYTGNSNNSVSEYKVNSTTGVLTPVSGSPITGFGSVNALVVDPGGNYLLVLDSTKKFVDTYNVNATTGALTLVSSVGTLAMAQTLTLDAFGLLTIVTNPTTIQASTFKATASITTTNPATMIAVDQSSQYILAAEAASKTLLTFAFGSNGSLTQLSSAPTGNGPTAILAEPSGKYVYVANSGDGSISAYSLNNSTGALSQVGSAVKAAAGTDSLAASNDGKYLYATDSAAGLVSIFKINTTGTLTAAGSATTGTAPTSIATTGTNQ